MELPPAPNMLDSGAPVLSPYLLPPLATPGLNIDTPFGDAPADEPLWVLPPEVIPERISTRPGAEPLRDRGFLDRPGTTDSIVTEAIEPDSNRLHEGLDWNYCGLDSQRRNGGFAGGAADNSPEQDGPAASTQPTDLDAGGLRYRRQTDVIDAVGGVTVVRGTQRVEADTLSYDRVNSTVSSPGTTYLQYPQLRLVGDGVVVNLETEQGRVDAPRFRLSGPLNVRGLADTAYVVSPTRTAYGDIIYTTCPPGSNAWSLRAGKLKLDQDSGIGVARNARLRIRGVPVMYTPYLQFPIDDRRRTGLLTPSFGSSDDNGFEFRAPYYWNIAPSMDATFYPRLMSERGVLLGGEFRYLTGADTGALRAEALPDDRKYDGGDSFRWGFHAIEDGLWFNRLRTELDYNVVSDDQYLEDLGNNIDATSTRRLRQSGQATYVDQGWSLLTQVEAFQNLDETISPGSRPYARLPRVLFQFNPAELLPTYAPGLVSSLAAEYDYFDHNHNVHGQRLTLTPVLSLPLRRSYGHLIPGARLYLSSYDLTDTDPGAPTSPSHAIPSMDLDGKLIFERAANWLGNSALQTLEPRLFYLYTPYVAQDQTPVFDSSELDFSFSNMFRNNRFTGRDRIGDANQVTAGITSRMLRAATGEELFRISLGQIYYFANRLVQIDDTSPQTQTQSPYTGELSARLFEHWSGRASFEWDAEADTDQWQRSTLQLQYSDVEQRQLNLAYRSDLTAEEANRYEDADMSFRLPFGSNLELVGRWLYSVRHNETMDAFAGIEFGKCCWRLRLLGRHFKRRAGEAASTSVMLQVELAGLGAIGDPIGEFLERELYGYNGY